MIERLCLNDILETHDSIISKQEFLRTIDKAVPRKTEIIFKNHDTGEILGREENKVVITGSILNACYAFGISPSYDEIPNYNKDLNLDNSVEEGEEPDNNNIVCLFCVDDSGCGEKVTDVYQVNYTDRIEPSSMLPFRYVDAADDLSEDLRKYYFGKKTLDDGSGKLAYYFKSFDTDPQLHLRYSDGTQINLSEIYSVSTSQMAECMVETRLRINRNDFRDYFDQVLGWDKARISSVSLCWGWYREFSEGDNTYKFYQGIRPYTKLNFPFHWLVDLTLAIDIIYRIYY